jgi:Mg2+ and Co2+ transporter CorA
MFTTATSRITMNCARQTTKRRKLVEDARRAAMVIDCAHYRDGQRQHEGPMELAKAANICRGADTGFIWLGLFEPAPQELAGVQQEFGLHDLAVEDAQNIHLRPKLELYDGGKTTFVVPLPRLLLIWRRQARLVGHAQHLAGA